MIQSFTLSARNLKNIRALTLAGMLLALHAVLGFFKIPFALENRITLTFAPLAAAGILLGPVPAMIIGGLGDILGYLLNPGGGAYFFGFTVSGMLGGLIYGFCLFKKEKKHIIWRIMLAVFLVTFFVNIILNTYWLSVMYAKAYQIFAIERIIKNFVAFPVYVVVIYAVFMLTLRADIRKFV